MSMEEWLNKIQHTKKCGILGTLKGFKSLSTDI